MNPDYNNSSWLDERIPLLYDWYDEYYDDLEMWHKLCKGCKGPILDLACGTGRVAIELARKGHNVVGLDISPHMIARAKERLSREGKQVQSRTRFEIGDMTGFDLGRRFPVALMPCFGFHELTSLEAQEACLRVISRHLDPGGVLILTLGFWKPGPNVVPPEEPADFGEPKEAGLNPNTGLFTRMWSLGWHDCSTQTRHYRFYFEESDESGQLIRRFAAPPPPEWHIARFLGRYEAEWLLERCGFTVDRIYGGWDFSELMSESKCIVFVARRGPAGTRKASADSPSASLPIPMVC